MIAAIKTALMHEEGLKQKLLHVQKTVKGTELSLLVNVIKECMHDMCPNIPIFHLKRHTHLLHPEMLKVLLFR